jgi:hypothetical protein
MEMFMNEVAKGCGLLRDTIPALIATGEHEEL